MDWLTEFPELGRRDMRDFRKSIDQGFKDFTRTYGEDIEGFFEPLPAISNLAGKATLGYSLAAFYSDRCSACMVCQS